MLCIRGLFTPFRLLRAGKIKRPRNLPGVRNKVTQEKQRLPIPGIIFNKSTANRKPFRASIRGVLHKATGLFVFDDRKLLCFFANFFSLKEKHYCIRMNAQTRQTS